MNLKDRARLPDVVRASPLITHVNEIAIILNIIKLADPAVQRR